MKKYFLSFAMIFSFIILLNAQDALTIIENGNVGVNNSTPAYTLDVSGDLHVSGNIYTYIESRGDFDITGTAADSKTFDLMLVVSEKNAGYKFRVSWHGGHGSGGVNYAAFGFVHTNCQIDGVSADEYIGYGTGHLDLFYLGNNKFETINAGEIWDGDGGNFGNQGFAKYLNGLMKSWSITYYATKTATSASGSIFYSSEAQVYYFPIDYVINPTVNPSCLSGGGINFPELISMSINHVSMFLSSSVINGNGKLGYDAIGYWTALYPRKY